MPICVGIKYLEYLSGAAIFQSVLYKHHIDSTKCLNGQIQNINVKPSSATLKLYFKANLKVYEVNMKCSKHRFIQ